MVGRYEVGDYRDRREQIDVVGLLADGRVDLGECKWQGAAAAPEATREIQRRLALYPAGDRTRQARIFLKARPRKPAGPAPRIHDLQALYGD